MKLIARTPSQLGSALARYRHKRELSQAELGDAAGLRQATVSKLESGSATTQIDTLCSVLAALDLELCVVPRGKSSNEDIAELF